MNLNSYSIINHKIDFNNSNYANLQNLLNTNFNNSVTLNSYLNELLFLKNNWNNQMMNDFVDSKLGGYWDTEILNEFNVTGKWFTFIGYDDLIGYIGVQEQVFYLENQILTNEAIVHMPINEFIDILQQWKIILDN